MALIAHNIQYDQQAADGDVSPALYQVVAATVFHVSRARRSPRMRKQEADAFHFGRVGTPSMPRRFAQAPHAGAGARSSMSCVAPRDEFGRPPHGGGEAAISAGYRYSCLISAAYLSQQYASIPFTPSQQIIFRDTTPRLPRQRPSSTATARRGDGERMYTPYRASPFDDFLYDDRPTRCPRRSPVYVPARSPRRTRSQRHRTTRTIAPRRVAYIVEA